MKALLLAGGTGSRLHPLTHGVNKHLLPVGPQPMIGHALTFLHQIGIHSVTIITTPEDLSGYGRLISSNTYPYTEYDAIYIAIQHKPAGIANAINYGEPFIEDQPFLVMLADNFYGPQDIPHIKQTIQNHHQGCHVWTTTTNKPQDVGILVLDHNNKPTQCIEKPKQNLGNTAITGLYLFDEAIWEYIQYLEPSARGEYEITDILNEYLNIDHLQHTPLIDQWYDLGGSLEQYLQHSARITQCTYSSPGPEASSAAPSSATGSTTNNNPSPK